jgi:transposase
VFEMLEDLLPPGLASEVQPRLIRRVATLGLSPMALQFAEIVDLLQPLWRAAMELVLNARVMYLDTLELPVLDGSKAHQPKLGSLWSFIGDEQTTLHLFTPSGQGAGELIPEDFLARRKGLIVARSSRRFATALQQQALTLCGCNQQAYSLFLKAEESGDTRASMPLAVFRQLDAVEKELRRELPEARRVHRRERSRPGHDDLVNWCRGRSYEPRSSPLGRAIHFVLDHEVPLRRFLDDGSIPMDTRLFERLPLRAALTRKSPLLASGAVGAHRAAVASTLLSCCQLAEVKPFDYLAEVLPHLSRDLSPAVAAELMPARWKASARRAPTDPWLGS